ncbi:NAD(P)/FAD-dependent oxidoreductase [Paraburkholderia sp. CNPSo 3274]|uniref:NAD(P)/FAD-dependent oxidoreductase n=1 Tax=Paraburkholderia sp. CNPSo 3274 TaxID=2940932 RepID=UPI0020B7EA6F|nr:NAD(P)/FAD-dependent oxidoreductase [Paraburkholderia sp. CNPSo 3274]MCP3710757.1 NAD(P)/FAD-dependent oxidoreductase [Paraburkholderia sp. CNPSo 3274]
MNERNDHFPPQLIETDALIIGTGPVGLFQVFELGLMEIHAHVVDSLPVVGGQCAELYPDKPIYDIPAVLMCTGQQLVDALMQQIEPFGATFHLGQEVQIVEPRADGRFFVQTSKGTQFLTKTVFIAAGVGSFQPRTLKLSGIERYRDTQLFYRVRDLERFRDKGVVVCGGGDSALDWALQLVDVAQSVILLHRREGYRAAPATVAKMHALCEEWRMQSIVGQLTGFDDEGGKLTRIKVTGGDGVTRSLDLDYLLVFYGLSPQLGPIAQWGLEIERKQLPVDTARFETSVPGIFAVGDINTYPGKKKLILSGFHEAALAAFAAAHHVFPEKKIHLQYTTTSTRLHKVLGVESPMFD